MKMKSNVFGSSAKLALAVLAVCGTLFTSCYEKEGLDNLPAAYYVAGSITDGTSGQPIKNATVTIGGTEVAATTGSFNHKVTTTGFVTVTVKANDFFDTEKTVFVAPVSEGQTYVAVADIALFNAASQTTDPLQVITPVLTAAEKTKIATALSLPENAKIEETEDGLVAVYETEFAATTDPKEVTVDYKEGFDLLADPTTRAISDKAQFIANVGKAIGKSHGLRGVSRKAILYANGASMIGAKITIVIDVNEFLFLINSLNYGGSAYWTSSVKAEPIVDTHDSHDAHGNNPNAGGGEGGSANS